MIDIPVKGQLASWAVARSLETISIGIKKRKPNTQQLFARILTDSIISLTFGNEIVFTNQNLLRSAQNGFSFPKIIPLFRNPMMSIHGIKTLLEIRKLYDRDLDRENVHILFSAGLEATSCYLNHHPHAKELMNNEVGTIDFYLKETYFLGRVSKSKNTQWTCKAVNPHEDSSVILNFKDLQSALRGTRGQIDPLADPALGNIQVSGRVPLLDKFGFVARIASREVPTPSNYTHAK
ncbi:MAG: hypothetical protein P8N49_05010 [Opitutales bacterium]|nr:hypothetical protein [Opitutales bacterium]